MTISAIEAKKSVRRIEQGKQQVYRLIQKKGRPYILIQTINSYERYHIIQYIKSHKLDFEIIDDENLYSLYLVNDNSLDKPGIDKYVEKVKKYGPGKTCISRYYKRPVRYIKVFRNI
jgi:hypothetical protein